GWRSYRIYLHTPIIQIARIPFKPELDGHSLDEVAEADPLHSSSNEVALGAHCHSSIINRPHGSLDEFLYFYYHRNMKTAQNIAKYADMFSAMGTEPRLRIMQLLLSAH